MTKSFSLQEIWQRGCKGETLTSTDQQHFTDLARSRFYTFQMSAGHAEQEKSESEAVDWINGLVTGLVKELKANPGLERAWHDSEFASGYHGQRVTSALSET